MQLPNGYEMETTYFRDFSLAEIFGTKAVQETYDKCFAERKNDKVYFSELAIVMNLKLWANYNKGNKPMYALFQSLYEAAEKQIFDNWSEEDVRHYLRVSD